MSDVLDLGGSFPGQLNISATGTTNATGYPIKKQTTVFSTVASGAIALLPNSCAAGVSLNVLNRGANTLTVVALNGAIENLGTSTTIAAGAGASFITLDPPSTGSRTWWLASAGSGGGGSPAGPSGAIQFKSTSFAGTANATVDTSGNATFAGTLAGTTAVNSGAVYQIGGNTAFNTSLSGNTANSPLFVGVGAGQNYTAGSAWDVAIGNNSLNTWTGVGSETVAVGTWSGRYLASGTGGNTLIGQVALGSDSTGAGNALVGHDVGYGQQNSQSQTGLGSNVLKFGSGQNNVAVGFQAMLGSSSSLLITGTVTTGDTLTLNYTSTAVNGGVEIQVPYTTVGGDTLATIATAWAAAINTAFVGKAVQGPNACSATATGNNISLAWAGTQTVGPVQPTLSVTVGGAATEVVTVQDGTTGTGGNTAIGYEAMMGLTQNSSEYCVAVGQFSLKSLTTGSFNTGVGTFSLNGLTSGARNTAIGYNSVPLLTTASDSTFLGAGTAINATTATQCVIIGSGSAAALTTGGNNVIVGYQAGLALTTANSSTIVGNIAGQAATVTVTLFGSGAGKNLTSGVNNTAVGVGALQGASASTANQNVAVGSNALAAVTNASGNIALGAGAGQAATSATGNILIGLNAWSSGLTSGAQNIVIACGTTAYNPANASDTLFIGCNNGGVGTITGTGINGTTPAVTMPGGSLTMGVVGTQGGSLVLAGATSGSITLSATATGLLGVSSAGFTANGAVATVLGSVGPTGANTTVQKWFTINDAGTTRYIPTF